MFHLVLSVLLAITSILIISLHLVTFVSRVLFLPNQRITQQEAAALLGPIAHRVPAT